MFISKALVKQMRKNEVDLYVLIWKDGLGILLSDKSKVQPKPYNTIQLFG